MLRYAFFFFFIREAGKSGVRVRVSWEEEEKKEEKKKEGNGPFAVLAALSFIWHFTLTASHTVSDKQHGASFLFSPLHA